MKNKHKQPILSYIFSTCILLALFISTMLNQYNNQIDWHYLKSATIKILIISFIPAVAIILLKVRKLHINIILSALLALGAATFYVQVLTKI